MWLYALPKYACSLKYSFGVDLSSDHYRFMCRTDEISILGVGEWPPYPVWTIGVCCQTGLHAGSFLEGDRLSKALEKRRLKEKYFKSLDKISCAQLEKTFVRASTPWADRYKLGLALIVERVITAPDNNVGIDEDTLSLIDDFELFFSYPWA
ncbi:Hypothetical predicted protein [Olea europaea subsp. europaea]|uniref:DUF1985 domain-containing protein n=1 Tax=Olea europaea subsp. europaea TaxID=158383 RepID=A0A8S0QRQ2_OLEEU|nr:Hypothetical predicted protein [Olea europaea subsp. europaea]